jgi:hypothetical protein
MRIVYALSERKMALGSIPAASITLPDFESPKPTYLFLGARTGSCVVTKIKLFAVDASAPVWQCTILVIIVT